MSWCGGGEISVTPGVECRTLAIHGYTLWPGQLTALAGLGALGHLDLQIVGVDEVLARHAEPARGDLLHGAAPPVAVGIPRVPLGVLAPFAGVRLPAQAVHGDGQRLVRFLADRPVGHRAGREAPHDRLDRFDLGQRDRRRVRPEIEQAAQRAQPPALIVDERRVPRDRSGTACSESRAEAVDNLGREEMMLAVPPPLVFAARVEARRPSPASGKGCGMPQTDLLGNHLEADAADARRGRRKVPIDERSAPARSLRRSAPRSSSAASRCPSWTSL